MGWDGIHTLEGVTTGCGILLLSLAFGTSVFHHPPFLATHLDEQHILMHCTYRVVVGVQPVPTPT